MNKITELLQRPHSPLRDSFSIFLLLASASGVNALIDPYVSLTSQSMIYVLAVVIAAYSLSWIYSVTCALAAVAALNFFFVPPRWTFRIDQSEHFIALITMLVLALVIHRLTSGLRRETEIAHLNEQRARQLQHLAVRLAACNTADDISGLGQQAFDDSFSGVNLLGLNDASGKLHCRNELPATIRDGMACCMKEGTVIGAGTNRWSDLDAWYLPIADSHPHGQMLGAVCIQSVSANDSSGRQHAEALCTILAQALLRLSLNASILAAQRETERQQLQGIFLAAVSHDLRTPLAVVVGAASALQLQHAKLSVAEQEHLLDSIIKEAGYLSALTENTLQLVRLENTPQSLVRDWESIEEIIGSVLARVRQHDTDKRIQLELPKGLPLVRVDPVLISQLLANLLENALKYTDGDIQLRVSIQGAQGSDEHNADQHQQWMLISVKDSGKGIPEHEQLSIFEPYVRGDHTDRSSQRGSGLGLAVCKAIATVHGGNLVLNQPQEGGSEFSLQLPLDAQPPAVAGELS
ncbi:DUF4118 domain-containing protein [Undibacterium sp. FT79W]|uniref:ATP-binding protein n=1 Tax=Undibacterium sp. FT79W TaxID=2762296 RepID=UPI00164CC1FA|nr:ATP-binding protein [Undibacterium sp. FT79W]MBC3878629.1 DUF4118 domain-containing protein [Undibacterium sp. FT79W]